MHPSPSHCPAAGTDSRPVARTAVLKRPGHFDLQTQAVPSCLPSEVLLRLEGCGICASSLPLWEGRPWFEYPLAPGVPGHEGWGHIAEVGEVLRAKRPDLIRGAKVACFSCRAFAGYAGVKADQIVALPDSLADQPFPGEAIGCAMNIFRRADIGTGQFTAIIGAGFLGLLLVQLAVHAGARVVVLTRRGFARNLASHFGAEAVFATDDWWGSAQQVMELTEGKGCERVVEATGMQFALDLATEIVGEYGRLVIAGYHQDGMRQVNIQKWNWRAIDVINAHERRQERYTGGLRAGIDAVQDGRIKLEKLLTHRFSLDGLDQAFQMVIDRPDGFIKGWVEL